LINKNVFQNIKNDVHLGSNLLFKQMVFDKILKCINEFTTHPYPDMIETLYQDIDDDYNLKDFDNYVHYTIDYFCMDYNVCEVIVKDFGFIEAIKSYNDDFGDIDFLKTDTECDITRKLAFHLIYQTLCDIDFNIFKKYCEFKNYEKECLYDEEYYDYIEDNIKRETYNIFSRNWNNLVYF